MFIETFVDVSAKEVAQYVAEDDIHNSMAELFHELTIETDSHEVMKALRATYEDDDVSAMVEFFQDIATRLGATL